MCDLVREDVTKRYYTTYKLNTNTTETKKYIRYTKNLFRGYKREESVVPWEMLERLQEDMTRTVDAMFLRGWDMNHVDIMRFMNVDNYRTG